MTLRVTVELPSQLLVRGEGFGKVYGSRHLSSFVEHKPGGISGSQ